jgi:VWFA-related protein
MIAKTAVPFVALLFLAGTPGDSRVAGTPGSSRVEPDGRAAQEPAPPSFPTGVEVVTIDAVVLDAQDRPVPGLTRNDFVVTEDGRTQEIAQFEAFVSGEAGPAEEPSAAAGNDGAARGAGRAFAVVVDDLRITPVRTEATRQAVVSFLERSLNDGDEVTLGTTSGDVWWSARVPEGREDLLAVAGRIRGRAVESNSLDRITEYEAFWINTQETLPAQGSLRPDRPESAPAADAPPEPNPGSIKERVKLRWKTANLCTGTSCDGMVRAQAAELDTRRQGRTRLTLETVRRGIEALADVHGRKSLLLLSEGFLQDGAKESREVAAVAREANAAVYFIDVKGLEALPGGGSAADSEPTTDPRTRSAMRFEESVFESAGAEALASETGGFSVRNSNDLAGGFGRIARESRVFYLLGFYPLEGKAVRKWRKVRVEVTRPGLTVRARRGYTLARETAGSRAARQEKKEKKDKGKPERTVDPAITRALDSAHDPAGIPLRAMAYVLEPGPNDTAHVVVAIELDASRLVFLPKGPSRVARVDLSVVARGRDSGRGFRHDDTLEISAQGAEAPGWRAVAREFELPPGVSQARVVVRDQASGARGAVSQRLEVLPSGSLRVSTPILTDQVEPAQKAGGRPRPALAAHRVFPPGGTLYCEFEVLGAVRSSAGAPRVVAGLELLGADGGLVRRADLTPIAPDASGRLVRLVGMGLEGMTEGSYELVLKVRDETSGARVERREPFTLAAPSASR